MKKWMWIALAIIVIIIIVVVMRRRKGGAAGAAGSCPNHPMNNKYVRGTDGVVWWVECGQKAHWVYKFTTADERKAMADDVWSQAQILPQSDVDAIPTAPGGGVA